MAARLAELPPETRARVVDYLDDQFQSISDLQNVNNLLVKLQEQQDALKTQLAEAKQEQEKADAKYQEQKAALKDKAERYQAHQADITRRLRAITQSEVSDEPVEQLRQPLQKLRRIEVAEQYVRTLEQINRLEKHAKDELKHNHESALQAYHTLQNLVYGIENAQNAAEGAAPQLLFEISKRCTAVHDSIREELDQRLRTTLDKMKWPAKSLTLAQPLLGDCAKYTELLLQLQEPQLLHSVSETSDREASEPTILLPLSVMAGPLSQRFRYHFYGDKPTNRLDKPEYFFSHVLDLVGQFSSFISDYLQPILDRRLQHNDQLDLVYTDAISSFITSLLPMVSAKCLSVLPSLTTQPQLMSHFVHELMSFDNTLLQSWAYAPFPGPLSERKGLTWDVLTKHGYFDTWLRLEKDFALLRYNKIIDDTESRSIDYDGVEEGRTKPTKGAIRINDLLEKITERYRMLASFSQKMKFLIDIQLAIFDKYHAYLYEHFRTYQAQSHTAGRLAAGAVSAGEALGLPGLESLVKIFGSAEYLERKMTDWSDDVFFLELWEELQDRASQNTGNNRSVGRGLSVEEVAAKTSSSIRNVDEMLESDGGALFDETAGAYRRLRESSEAEIVRLLQVNARNSLKAFQALGVWASLSTTVSDPTQISPSSALDSFSQIMTPLLQFLAKASAPTSLRRVAKQLCHTIQEDIYDRLLLRNNFSAAGANQLKRDVIAICSIIDSSLRMPGESERHLIKLYEAMKVLSLPIKSSRGGQSAVNAEQDEWGFDDEDDAAQGGIIEEMEEDDWGLWQAEKAIFADNASARAALQSMDLNDLSEGDARNIIRRRIEINS